MVTVIPSEGEGSLNKEGRIDERNGRSSRSSGRSNEDDFLSTNEKLFLRATESAASLREGDEGKKCGGLVNGGIIQPGTFQVEILSLFSCGTVNLQFSVII